MVSCQNFCSENDGEDTLIKKSHKIIFEKCSKSCIFGSQTITTAVKLLRNEVANIISKSLSETRMEYVID